MAAKYREIKASYKEVSLQLALIQVKDKKDKYQNLQNQIREAEDGRTEWQSLLGKAEAELQEFKNSNLDKEKALSASQRMLNELIDKIRTQENDKNIFTERISYIANNRTRLQQEIEASKKRLGEAQEKITSNKRKLGNTSEDNSFLEQEMKKASAHLEDVRNAHSSLRSELDDYIKNQSELEQSIFELEKARAIHESQGKNLEEEMQRNESEMKTHNDELKRLRNNISEVDKEKTTLQEEISKIEQSETQRKKELADCEANFEIVNSELQRLNRSADAKRNEFELTKSLVENLEGFPESIKFLNKNKDWTKNALLVSDIFYTKEEYRVALENHLEPYLNYYVVQTYSDAKQAIQLLGRSQKGRANFFILEAFESYTSPSFITPANAVAAIDLVDVDEPYRRLAAWLFDRVFVTSGALEDVQQVPGTMLLSKDGRFSQGNFTLSGGSVGLFEGKRIGRRKNLEILEKAILELDKKIKESLSSTTKITSDIDRLKRSASESVLKEKQNLLNEVSERQVTYKTKLENYEAFLGDISKKWESALERIRAIENMDNETMQQLNSRQSEREKLTAMISEKDGSFADFAKKLNSASEAFKEKEITFIKQQNEIDQITRELEFYQNIYDETSEKLSSNKAQMVSADQETEDLKNKIGVIETDLITHYEQQKQSKADLGKFEESYFSARNIIHEKEEHIRTINRSGNQKQLLLTELKDKFNEIKLSLSSIDERMKVEFSISLDQIIEESNKSKDQAKEANQEDLEERVFKMRRRLENYGEINPMAVEAFNEMQERHSFITGQIEDLRDSKKSLLATIDEIENTATEHFMEAFDRVKLNFQKVFRSLFSVDDDCDLRLADPSMPLDSKILIEAKPKGKRPITIDQLSGGEKTLTATALLFSLYLLKPAPFCVFDEVDAPLDDSNISKFNKIIKEFSGNSQFIIITHNKLTMDAMDVIYGVTMAEQGISSVLPTNLNAINYNPN